MQEKNKRNEPDIDEVLDNEVDEIWDIFFPYMSEKKEKISLLEVNEPTKPRRHLRFLSM